MFFTILDRDWRMITDHVRDPDPPRFIRTRSRFMARISLKRSKATNKPPAKEKRKKKNPTCQKEHSLAPVRYDVVASSFDDGIL